MVVAKADFWQMIAALGEFGMAVVLAVTAIAGYKKYKESKYKERLEKDLDMRHDFILNPMLNKIQDMIEHGSDKLAAVLTKLVDAKDNPHKPELLDESERALHQELDNYLNFLEIVGSLRSRRWLKAEDFAGFWDYYFGRIGEWDLLYRYVSHPKYKWENLTHWAKVLNNTDYSNRPEHP